MKKRRISKKHLEKLKRNAKEIPTFKGLIEKEKSFAYNKHHLSSTIFMLILLVIAVSNFIVNIFLAPVIVLIKEGYVFVLFGSLALVFGILFAFLAKETSSLGKKIHFEGIFVIIVLAMTSVFVSVKLANALSNFSSRQIHLNPAPLCLVYALCFVLPYLLLSSDELIEKGARHHS